MVKIQYKTKYYLLLMLYFFISISILQAQEIINSSDPDDPNWIAKRPSGKYYRYFVANGLSRKSLNSAKKQAITNIFSSINMEGEITVKSKIKTDISEKSISENSDTNTIFYEEAAQEVIAEGKSSKIENLSKVDDYWEVMSKNDDLIYEYWVLMRMLKPEYEKSDVQFNEGYGLTPIIKSSIIPGWGQFHKGEYNKGLIFLTTETVSISSFFISYYLSHDYSQKAENERDYEKRKYYNKWSNRSYSIGTISAIIAGSIHVFNIFDSITSEGAKKYAFNNRDFKVYTNTNCKEIKVSICFKI